MSGSVMSDEVLASEFAGLCAAARETPGLQLEGYTPGRDPAMSASAEPMCWQADLVEARRVHDLLQIPADRRMDSIQFASVSLPARIVGGDYIDLLEHQGRARVVIADAMGHGVAAAMQVMMVRTAVRMAAAVAASPGELLTFTHRALRPDLRALGSLVTMLCAEYDPAQRILTCANAGHPYPLVLRAQSGRVEPIPVTGTALGVHADADYNGVSVALQSADMVLFYTDGAVDVTDPEGHRLRTAGLMDWLRMNAHCSVANLVQRLAAGVQTFAGHMRPRDDVSFAVVRVR